MASLTCLDTLESMLVASSEQQGTPRSVGQRDRCYPEVDLKALQEALLRFMLQAYNTGVWLDDHGCYPFGID